MFSQSKFIFVSSSLLVVVLLTSPNLVTSQEGTQEDPKKAQLGSNSGNIATNEVGGRFFFNFSLQPDQSYNFELSGADETKFDIYFFDSSYLPSLIVEDSEDFDDSYPVVVDNFRTANEWTLIQIYSNPGDGGIGDFTLTIIDNSTVENAGTPGFFGSTILFSLLVIVVILKSKKLF